MSDILTKAVVLVLNHNWQAINPARWAGSDSAGQFRPMVKLNHFWPTPRTRRCNSFSGDHCLVV